MLKYCINILVSTWTTTLRCTFLFFISLSHLFCFIFLKRLYNQVVGFVIAPKCLLLCKDNNCTVLSCSRIICCKRNIDECFIYS